MSALHAAMVDYLALRRGLGYQLNHDERELRSFVAFCDDHDTQTVTVEAAAAWVTLPVGTRPSTTGLGIGS